VMRTQYRIDDFQVSYFAIRNFDELFEATRPDFAPYYAELARQADLEAGSVLPTDRVLHRGIAG
jgi:phenylalanine-4-hydroxylase